jgi:cyanophycinase
MISVSAWKKGELITAITLPSSYDSSYYWINDQLQRITGQACVKFDSIAVFDDRKLDSLSRSRIIFIGGGDQALMMQRIKGSRVKEIIRTAFLNGATIGGTSAGAAIMSEMMITGNQLLDTVYSPTFPVLRQSNLELKEGLGLLDSTIIDMHFIARSRYNRLFSAVIEHPGYQCVGIDEATAIIVRNDSAEVKGESEVFVIETPDDITKGNQYLMGAKDIDVSVYLPGERFQIKR